MEEAHCMKIKSWFCLCDPDYMSPAKVYTIKKLVMMETYIYDFYTSSTFQKFKNAVSPPIRTHFRDTSLWQHTP